MTSVFNEISEPDDVIVGEDRTSINSTLGEDAPILANQRRFGRHASFTEHRTYLSIVAEDLSRIPSYAPSAISVTLEKCRQKVVKHYETFLRVVGWEPAFRGFDTCGTILNVLHPALVIALILLAYFIQWAGCFCRFMADTSWSIRSVTLPEWNTTSMEYDCSEYFFSRILFVDILHSVAYTYSFYILRISDPKQMASIIERVFIFTTKIEDGSREEEKMIRRLRRILYGSTLWILLSLGADVMHVISQHESIHFRWIGSDPGNSLKQTILIIIMITGWCFLNIVSMAVVVNYTVQCRLLMFYIDGLIRKLHERTIRLFEAMKECEKIRTQVDLLNRHSGVALSVVLVNFFSAVSLGLFSMLSDDHTLTALQYASTIISILLWLTIIVWPIIMGAMLTSRCDNLHNMGLVVRMRSEAKYEDVEAPNNEQKTMEINSFVIYMTALKPKAKLYLLPVRSGYVMAMVLVSGMTILLLFQLGVIHLWV